MAFAPGTAVALREVVEGRIWSARPAIVVRDDPEIRMFFTPIGITMWIASDDRGTELRIPEGDWRLRPLGWKGWHVLSFAWPDERHAVLAMWDEGWRFARWYVNVEEPLRRTAIGFDTTELLLDVVIDPDLRTWRWKDEDELMGAVRVGLFSSDDVDAFREAAQRGRRRVMDREPPFDRDWTTWRPDPTWRLPELPASWADVEPHAPA